MPVTWDTGLQNSLCNFKIFVKETAITFNWQHFSLILIFQTNSPTAGHFYGPMFEACVYSFINVFETTNPISKIPVNRLCSSAPDLKSQRWWVDSVPEYSINLSSKKFYIKIKIYYTSLFTLINKQMPFLRGGNGSTSTVLLCGINQHLLGLHMNTSFCSNCNFCSFVRIKVSMSQS
jgi:hypothetical protein